jgi:ABC-type multidrug transport system permease subunit
VFNDDSFRVHRIDLSVSLLVLPNNQLPPWISWFKWLNPLFYSLEGAFINEFNGTTIQCAAPALIPYGQNYPTSGDNIGEL